MPELPEVETIARGLKPHLEGRRVHKAELRRKDLYRSGSLRLSHLNGRMIVSVDRLGKNVLFRFDPTLALVVNLGMTGNLILFDPAAPHPPRKRKHLHGRLHLSNGTELHYYDTRRFGFFFLSRERDVAKQLNIGHDPFQMKPREFKALLSTRSAPIKSILLNQRLIAGIGNIYADESLYRAKIHPAAAAREAASNAKTLLAAVRQVLKNAIRSKGTTLRDYRSSDNTKGSYQNRLDVYGREGAECMRCKTVIIKIMLGGRGTHFCPQCQPHSP